MNKNNQILLGIFIIFIVMAGMWFWFRTSVPSASEKQAAIKTISSVDPNILERPEVEEITSSEINGTIPVEVKTEETGRDNPFGEY